MNKRPACGDKERDHPPSKQQKMHSEQQGIGNVSMDTSSCSWQDLDTPASFDTADPDYESYTPPESRQTAEVDVDKAREATVRKIVRIVSSKFDEEIAHKEKEIFQIDERLQEARTTMDRLRACVVTCFYRAGVVHTPQQPTIHPMVKKFLQRTQKGGNDVKNEDTEESRDTSDAQPDPPPEKPLKTENADIRSPERVTASTRKAHTTETPKLPRPLRSKQKRKLIVGNVSKFLPPEHRTEKEQATHKWMAYVRGPRDHPDISDIIEKAVFLLHPSYRPHDLVTVNESPFHLTRRGWGEFPLRVQLHFKDRINKKVDIIHNLQLDKTYTGLQTLGAETAVEIELETAVEPETSTVPPRLVEPLPSVINSTMKVSSSETLSNTNLNSRDSESEIKSELSLSFSQECQWRRAEMLSGISTADIEPDFGDRNISAINEGNLCENETLTHTLESTRVCKPLVETISQSISAISNVTPENPDPSNLPNFTTVDNDIRAFKTGSCNINQTQVITSALNPNINPADHTSLFHGSGSAVSEPGIKNLSLGTVSLPLQTKLNMINVSTCTAFSVSRAQSGLPIQSKTSIVNASSQSYDSNVISTFQSIQGNISSTALSNLGKASTINQPNATSVTSTAIGELVNATNVQFSQTKTATQNASNNETSTSLPHPVLSQSQGVLHKQDGTISTNQSKLQYVKCMDKTGKITVIPYHLLKNIKKSPIVTSQSAALTSVTSQSNAQVPKASQPVKVIVTSQSSVTATNSIRRPNPLQLKMNTNPQVQSKPILSHPPRMATKVVVPAQQSMMTSGIQKAMTSSLLPQQNNVPSPVAKPILTSQPIKLPLQALPQFKIVNVNSLVDKNRILQAGQIKNETTLDTNISKEPLKNRLDVVRQDQQISAVQSKYLPTTGMISRGGLLKKTHSSSLLKTGQLKRVLKPATSLLTGNVINENSSQTPMKPGSVVKVAQGPFATLRDNGQQSSRSLLLPSISKDDGLVKSPSNKFLTSMVNLNSNSTVNLTPHSIHTNLSVSPNMTGIGANWISIPGASLKKTEHINSGQFVKTEPLAPIGNTLVSNVPSTVQIHLTDQQRDALTRRESVNDIIACQSQPEIKSENMVSTQSTLKLAASGAIQIRLTDQQIAAMKSRENASDSIGQQTDHMIGHHDEYLIGQNRDVLGQPNQGISQIPLQETPKSIIPTTTGNAFVKCENENALQLFSTHYMPTSQSPLIQPEQPVVIKSEPVMPQGQPLIMTSSALVTSSPLALSDTSLLPNDPKILRVGKNKISNTLSSALVLGVANPIQQGTHQTLFQPMGDPFSDTMVTDDKAMLKLFLERQRKEKGPKEVKLPAYQLSSFTSVDELLFTVLKLFPVVQENPDRELHPYCAASRDQWLSWPLGKRRASELSRAVFLRRALIGLLEGAEPHGLTLPTNQDIITWCRNHAFTPLDKQCRLGLEGQRGELDVHAVSSLSVSDHILSVCQQQTSQSPSPRDQQSLVDVDVIDCDEDTAAVSAAAEASPVKQCRRIRRFLPPPSECGYVQRACTQIGVRLRPVEFEDEAGDVTCASLNEQVLWRSAESFMETLLRKSFSAVLSQARVPEHLDVHDIFTAINSTPQFDFLSNCYLATLDS